MPEISNHLKECFENEMAHTKLVAAADWIGKYMSPEDVFPEEKLAEWAIRNGFEREREHDWNR